MRILFLTLLLSSPSLAGGPLFKNKDRYTQQEFDNVYQDIRGKQSQFPLLTKAQLGASTPTASNLLFICSDCTTTGLVISTGTVRGAFGVATAKTTAIN